jgi:hypothetical protein
MHWAMAESVALEQVRLSRRAGGRAARDGGGAP